MWADNRVEIIIKMRGRVVPEKSREGKTGYIINNYMGPVMQIYAV